MQRTAPRAAADADLVVEQLEKHRASESSQIDRSS
jgi:hypothetical protein